MTVTKLYDNYNIYHALFEDQFIITSTLMRIQEFYESNIPELRNQYFTLENLIHEYTISNGGTFDYFTKWSGFNFPSEVLIRFIELFRNDLSNKELNFLNILISELTNESHTSIEDMIELLKKNPIYIISTYRKNDIIHETAHALYNLNLDYRTKMNSLCQDLPSILYEAFYEQLQFDGYCDEVICDEIQAYMISELKEDLVSYCGIDIDDKIYNNFKSIFTDVKVLENVAI